MAFQQICSENTYLVCTLDVYIFCNFKNWITGKKEKKQKSLQTVIPKTLQKVVICQKSFANKASYYGK